MILKYNIIDYYSLFYIPVFSLVKSLQIILRILVQQKNLVSVMVKF